MKCDPSKINHYLTPKSVENQLLDELSAAELQLIQVKQTTSSTNQDAFALAEQGYLHALCLAFEQTAGRGQHQRSWHSPYGNLYLSLLHPLQRPLDGRLALECGLNIIDQSAFDPFPMQLKWPNDLYYKNKKWGGILIEPITPKLVVIGVGININPDSYNQIKSKDEIKNKTNLQDIGLSMNYISLCKSIYQAINSACQWFDNNSSNLASRFSRHAAYLNQQMQIIQQNSSIAQGQFTGIQQDGAVILQSSVGSQAFYKGQFRPIIDEC